MSTEAPSALRADACPEPEQLAAYIDGALGAAERTLVERHLLTCADCREIVAGSVEALNEIAPAPAPATPIKPFLVPRRPRRTLLWAGVGTILAAAAALSIAIRLFYTAPAAELTAVLADATGQQRLIEPRLSGGFAYAPLSIRRGNEQPQASPDLRIADARIEKQLTIDRSAAVLHAHGAARLLLGDSDSAVNSLTEAARAQPDSPAILSDLAAALIVRGTAQERPVDLTQALEAIERIPPAARSPESLFNRALALEGLKLREQAREAWNTYLQRDSQSGWADEARRHLKTLTEQSRGWSDAAPQWTQALERGVRPELARIARAFPAPARDYVQDELLPAWARSCAARCDASLLDRAEWVGTALADAGDRLDVDTVRILRTGVDATGVIAYGEARALYKANAYEAATIRFRAAAARLSAARLPLALEAGFYVQVMEYRDGRTVAADRRIQQISAAARTAGYRGVDAKCHWIRGLIALSAGRHADAVAEYEAAEQLFAAAGDRHDVGNVHLLLSEVFELLGQDERAWRERVTGHDLLDATIDGRRWIGAMLSAAIAAETAHAPRAAAAFATDIIRGDHQPSVTDLAEAHLRRASSLLEVGDMAAARQDAAQADRFIAQVQDEWAFQRLHAEAAEVGGQLALEAQPELASRLLTEAIGYFDRVGAFSRSADLALPLERSERRQGNAAAAQQSLARGIAAFEQIRGGLTGDQLRISFFDRAWDLFDDMVHLELARGHTDEAFAYAERARARALLDAWRVQADQIPRTPAAVAAALPAGTTMVYFCPEGAWTIALGRSRFVPLPAAATAAPHVQALIHAMQSESAGAMRSESAALYTALWAPLAPLLAPGQRLAIVPSRALQLVPFAALQNAATGRRLIDDHELVVAPSAALFLAASDHLGISIRPRTALIAGASGTGREDAVGAPLKAVNQEISQIAAVYPSADVLSGTALTRSAFVAALDEHDVVHFAGHAYIDARFPFLSKLVLNARPGAATEDITAADLGSLSLRRPPRLVVLAACRSAAGVASGDGSLSVARPFLAAGVPAVVAALWDIDDASAARFMRLFHRHYIVDGDAAAALRAAQLETIQLGTDAGDTWAAFSIIGGAAQPRPAKESS